MLECSAKKEKDQHRKLRSFELAYLGCISGLGLGLGAPCNLSLQWIMHAFMYQTSHSALPLAHEQ